MLALNGKMLTANEQIAIEESLKDEGNMKMRWNDMEDCFRTVLREMKAKYNSDDPIFDKFMLCHETVMKLDETLAAFTGRGSELVSY